MAFAVTCKHCQARFLLNDDLLRRRVAGKVVTVRCRQCHSAIEVDASDLDPKSFPKPKQPEVTSPVPTKTLLIKPAPPRPAKSSTLIGIGGPPRPADVPELRALSPGLLNVKTQELPVSRAAEAGFPEPPPPPPASHRELDSDWDEQTPPKSEAEAAPESIDDFEELPQSTEAAPESIEEFDELPPSDPPAATLPAVIEDPQPSSSGTPTLQTLTMRDKPAEAPAIDDFFASMRPREEKNTLPLFELPGDPNPLFRAPAPATPPPLAAPAAPSQPATEARASADVQVPSSGRTRKHVIAPSTQSVPPAAPAQRRSSLALPVLLVLALAAGFLIWKRSSAAPAATAASEPSAPAIADEGSKPAPTVVPAPATEPASARNEPAPAPLASNPPSEPAMPASAASTSEALGKGAPAAPAPHEPARAATTPTPTPTEAHAAKSTGDSTGNATAEPASPAPEAARAEPKSEPAEPTPPSEPAGPFDRDAAAAALSAAAARAASCRKPGDPSGVANVVITFAPSGRVTTATISGPPYAGTPTGGCIASTLRKARVPAFEGDRVTVSKTIVIE